jgi:hypothetical protein
VWVLVSVPFVTGLGLLADTPDAYVFVMVFFASGAFTTPALVVTWMASRRTAAGDRRSWQLWLGGLITLYAIGLAMLLGIVRDRHVPLAVGVAVVLVTSAFLNVALVRLVQARSGGRAWTVDVTEGLICLVTVAAPAALLFWDTVLDADARWYAIPAVVALLATAFGTYWSLVLHVRLGPESGATERYGIALGVVAVVNSAAQVAQGVTGFDLPAPPLIFLHAVTMSLLLLVPLALPRGQTHGLSELPHQAQVRGGGLAAVVTLAGLPVLLGTALAVRSERSWALPFSWATLAVLLALGAVRHLATVRETRRLYGAVERAAQLRRELLAEVVQQADDDRHRVAAQLHEQAVATYASFVSFIHASSGTPAGPGRGGTGPLTSASSQVRSDLARHADSLRQLMLAIAPLEPRRTGRSNLEAPMRAHLDRLYGDRPTPAFEVSVIGPLVLDWVTETIVLRIVQEALRAVHDHGPAHRVAVAIVADGPAVELRISHDGPAVDPTRVDGGPGIVAMRSYAAAADGRLDVGDGGVGDGPGTTIVVRLGAAGDDEPGEEVGGEVDPPVTLPSLRLLRGDGPTDA